jgi:hypothetical protein
MKPLQMQQPASGGKRVRDSDSEFQSEDEDDPKTGVTGQWTETWFHVDVQGFKLRSFTKLETHSMID